MKVTLGVLADAANVSREGKLNILGEFNMIYAHKVPVRWPLMQLVLRIEATGGEDEVHSIGIRVVDEDGKIVAPPIDGQIRIPPAGGGKRRRVQLILGIEGASFANYGTYEFDILIDGQSHATIPLHIAEVPATAQPAPEE